MDALLPKSRKVFAGNEKVSILEEKFHQVLQVISVDEVIVALEMMLAKDKFERSLGIKKKLERPPKGKSS
ncbi:MAG: hypothetical protein EOP06_00130 [Proteobacteria bacterium]|nr:MAG: hypothetical protein EOP06_00130 [Pseudomonadota bacterium]